MFVIQSKILRDSSATILHFDQLSYKIRRSLKGHQGKILRLDWTKNGQKLISSSQDGEVIMWDAFSSQKDIVIPQSTPWTMACSIDSVGSYIACGGVDNKCSIYDIQDLEDIASTKRTIATHTSYISDCKFIYSDCQLLTASGDTTCALWDVETSQMIYTFHGHKADVLSLDLCPTFPANLIASGSCDNIVKIWDLRQGQCTHSFEDHKASVNCVKFFPTGDVIGSASDDGTCRLFDLRAMQGISIYKRDSIIFGVSSLDFTKSGRLLLAGYYDFNIHAWDTLKMERVSTLYGHESRVSCLKMSPDGFGLASGSWDQTVKVSLKIFVLDLKGFAIIYIF
ncbi:uncharacterized protein TRIADDRAFT_49804 [Trichoplax adhaerens]|uniref:Uncharacterized protein n=1 Tax=Trichoplax adhaerens TaxID=10228 RepID=B3RJH0_TRIAD|nr:hypothetical protein TRIADDRAFT_49804 [Trichoplax adhaerens]EDV29817.1 hypothetical protein TRIADDRAFT_49804 [Trichoplax adhaerens]|eukprot:XP_002109019.1 hypothetical protein TRIADDRAFT_49804 [Trichoplax adhaerens]